MRLSDYLFGPDAKPLKSVYVRLVNYATGESQIARTASDGKFTIDLPPGTYSMEKSGPGEPWRRVGIDLDLRYLRE